jgi:MoaA/NifB/PqqE/SkfB family radical SAM enzyme
MTERPDFVGGWSDALNTLANGLHVARLTARHSRFAEAIAVRRLAEAVYVHFPKLAAKRPLATPVEVVIAVSSVCQLSCRMCGLRRIMKQPAYAGRTLSHADLAPALAEMSHWSPRPYVKFTGGEPLIIGDELFSMLEDCRRRRLPARVSTNGILLAEKDIAAELVRTGVDVVTVSLDGPRDVHNAVRGRDFAFDRTVEGIRRLHEVKRAVGRQAPLVQVTSVIHADNFGRLREIYELCRTLPVQWWNVQLLNFVSPDASDAADATAREWGYAPGPWRAFANDALRRVDARVLSLAVTWVRRQRSPFAISLHHVGGYDADRLRAYYAGSGAPLSRKICAVPFIAMHIAPNGDLVFCIDYPYVTYGNLRESPLRAAWRSAPARAFRDHLLTAWQTAGCYPPQCNRCNWMFN